MCECAQERITKLMNIEVCCVNDHIRHRSHIFKVVPFRVDRFGKRGGFNRVRPPSFLEPASEHPVFCVQEQDSGANAVAMKFPQRTFQVIGVHSCPRVNNNSNLGATSLCRADGPNEIGDQVGWEVVNNKVADVLKYVCRFRSAGARESCNDNDMG